MTAWPFFTYFGGKWRIAKRYPKPTHDTLIEPFAGSAGYAVKWQHPKVRLYDLNQRVVGVWKYLIGATRRDILALPTEVKHVDSLSCSEEAKWLIGFWLNKGCTEPKKTPSAWMRSGIRPKSMWGQAIKERIAHQLPLLKDWKVFHGSYAEIPNGQASWFIDPPYEKQGGLYTHSSIEYSHLADWCKGRNGQVIVCESSGAAWLPFRDFYVGKGLEGKRGKKRIHEAIWVK